MRVTPDVLRNWIWDAEEKAGLKATDVTMNAHQYADLRKWGRDFLDVETSASLMKSGVMARFQEVTVRVSRRVLNGEFVVHFNDGTDTRRGPCLEDPGTICDHEGCRSVHAVLES